MKTSKILWMVVLLTVMLAACHMRENSKVLKDNVEQIDIPIIGEQAIDFSEVWDIMSFTQLEISPSSMIGQLKKVIVEGGKVYILNAGEKDNLKIFSLEGKYLGGIDRSGKGPGEYVVIEDFMVADNGHIEIMDSRGKKLIVYDDSLNFLYERALPFFAFSFIENEGFYWFYTGTSYNDDFSYKLIVMDSSLTTIVKRYFPFDESELKHISFADQKNFGIAADEIHFQYSYNDTIYKIEKDVLTKTKYINFNKKNMPEKFKRGNYVDVIEFLEKCNASDYAYWVDGYTEGPKMIIFSFNYKDKRFHSYSNESGTVLVGNTINNYLGIEGYDESTTRFNLPVCTDGEDFYFFINPIEFQAKVRTLLSDGSNAQNSRDSNIIDLIESASINDNPIMVKLKPKG